MSRKFTGRLTTDELAGAIALAYSEHRDFEGEVSVADCNSVVRFLKENYFHSAVSLTPQVEADLKKVDFCDENSEWETSEGFCGCEKITGFQTLPNGLTYLGITAGGDWETPLFYIVYWDGEKLRGYVPTAGNFWNTDTNTAYGSEGQSDGITDDEKAQKDNLQKRFGVDDKDQLGDMDTDAILEDIQNRIKPSSGAFTKPKGLADIDPKRIESNKAAIVTPCAKPFSSMNSFTVMGNPLPEVMENGVLAKRLVDVRSETETFLKELDELAKMDMPEALVKAVQVRDGSLRRLVVKYVQAIQ